jgi:hypothetical protein
MRVHTADEFAAVVQKSVTKAVGDFRLIAVKTPNLSNGYIEVVFEARGVRCTIDRDRMELALECENTDGKVFRPQIGIFDSDYTIEKALEDLCIQLVNVLPFQISP